VTLPLPYGRVIETAPDGRERLNPTSVQGDLDAIAQVFPLDNGDIGNGVLKLLSSTTKRTVAWGSASVTFTASAFSAGTAVTHGLPSTPVVVLALGTEGGSGRTVLLTVRNIGASTFEVTGYNTPGTAITTSTSFYWLAIG
jgi:hypothetical protein